MKKIILLVFMAVLPCMSNATEWIEIDNASELLWQINSAGIVYFRNLNEFDAEQAGCCYAYKLDTTTDGGKVIWSTILAKMAGHKRITLGFPNIGSNENPQTLSAIGRHTHGTNQ